MDGGQRHQFSRFPDHTVAVGERGRDLPGWNGDRKIPGCDGRHHANRFAPRVQKGVGGVARVGLAVRLEGLGGVVAEDLDGSSGFADALGQGFAFLARQIAPDVGGACLEQVGGLAQDVTTPWCRRRSPAGDGSVRRGHGIRGDARIGLHDLRDGLRGASRVEIAAGPATLTPGPTDERLQSRHRRLQAIRICVGHAHPGITNRLWQIAPRRSQRQRSPGSCACEPA